MEHKHSPQSEQKTIMVAANDRGVLDFISGFLVTGSYNVLSAGGGEDAVQQMTKYKREIHLLLSTLDMPGTNGLGLGA